MTLTITIESVYGVAYRATITDPDDPFGPPLAESPAMATPRTALKALIDLISIEPEDIEEN